MDHHEPKDESEIEDSNENDESEIQENPKPEISKARRRMEQIKEKKAKGKASRSDIADKKDECVKNGEKENEKREIDDGTVKPQLQNSSWEHSKQPSITGPITVAYCQFCGLPPDYCEYGEKWETECKAHAIKHYPEYYPQYQIEGNKCELPQEMQKKPVVTKKPVEGKKKKVLEGVTVQRVSRAKRKTVTVVIGLETVGVKLEAAAKLFSKKFSCGASVVKGGNGLPDQIDIQGDVEESIAAAILAAFPEVDEEKIKFLKPK